MPRRIVFIEWGASARDGKKWGVVVFYALRVVPFRDGRCDVQCTNKTQRAKEDKRETIEKLVVLSKKRITKNKRVNI